MTNRKQSKQNTVACQVIHRLCIYWCLSFTKKSQRGFWVFVHMFILMLCYSQVTLSLSICIWKERRRRLHLLNFYSASHFPDHSLSYIHIQHLNFLWKFCSFFPLQLRSKRAWAFDVELYGQFLLGVAFSKGTLPTPPVPRLPCPCGLAVPIPLPPARVLRASDQNPAEGSGPTP